MTFTYTFIEKERHVKAPKSTTDDAEKDKEEGADDEESEEEEEDDHLSEVDDEEIEAMILTEEEVNLKTRIWYNANKEYLEEMAVRRLVEKDKGNPYSRKSKGQKKKKHATPNTPAEAAKQLLNSKKLSKKINQAVFDDMFESPESIAKIKQRDVITRIRGETPSASIPEYEVVEEPGDVVEPSAAKKKTVVDGEEVEDAPAAEAVVEEDDDDEDMDSDDMADDERLMRDARAKYAFDEDDDAPEYNSDDY